MEDHELTQLHETLTHKSAVSALLLLVVNHLTMRGIEHDLSKFSPEEFGPLSDLRKLAMSKGPVPFGSEEYKARSFTIKEALDLHRSKNRHHPEFHPNGVKDMNLIDLLEMVCDWSAASIRNGDNKGPNLNVCKAQFGISDELFKILLSTFDCLELSYQYDPPITVKVSTGTGSAV